MSFGIWQRTITDDEGNVLPGASIEVRAPSSNFTGSLVSLFSNEAGSTGLANPFNADSEGFAQFYAAPRKVDIRATSAGSQRTWRNVEILGTAATKGAETESTANTVVLRDGNGTADFGAVPTVNTLPLTLSFSSVDGLVWSETEPSIATLTLAGIKATDRPFVDIDLSSVAFEDVLSVQADWALVYRVEASADDELKLYAVEKPMADFILTIKVVR